MEFLTKVAAISKKSLDILNPLLDKDMKESPVFKLVKDFVPGLEAAAGLAQIWTEERKKAAIPEKAAAILSKELGIDVPAEADKDQLVRRLAEQGIESPDQLVGTVISRLQAAVKHPELVDMLHRQHRDISNALSRNLKSLEITLSAGFRVLIPLEKVLEVYTLEKELADPVMFRKGGPLASDLENNMAVVEEKQVLSIEKQLKENEVVLIQGRPASGKTILIWSLAYHMYRKQNRRIWMLRLKEDPFDFFELTGEINRLASMRPRPVVVIEDAHLYKNEINSLLLRKEENWPLIVLSSRGGPDHGPGHESDQGSGHGPDGITSYLERLHKIPLVPDQATVVNIVRYFFTMHKLPFSDDIAMDYHHMTDRNLMLLNYALTSSLENGGIPDKKRMLDRFWQDLSDIFIRNGYDPVFPRAVLALSLLSRYEISTDSRYLEELFGPEIYPALEHLARQHEIFKRDQDKRFYYGLLHSAYADQYVQFIRDSVWHTDKYEDGESFLLQYIQKPYTRNAFQVIDRLIEGKSGEDTYPAELGQKLSWETIYHKLRRFKSVEYIETLFRIADAQQKKELIRIVNRPENTYLLLTRLSPWHLEFMFSLFSNADPEGYEKFLDGLEFNIVQNAFLHFESPVERLEFAFIMANVLPHLSDNILELLMKNRTWEAMLATGRRHQLVELLLKLERTLSFAGRYIDEHIPAGEFCRLLRQMHIKSATLFICNWNFDHNGPLSRAILDKLQPEKWLADLYKKKDISAFLRLLTVGTQNPSYKVDWDRFIVLIDLKALIRDLKSDPGPMNKFKGWCESYRSQMAAWLLDNYDTQFIEQLLSGSGDGVFFDGEAELIEKFNPSLLQSMWQNVNLETIAGVLKTKSFQSLPFIVGSLGKIVPELGKQLAENHAQDYLKAMEKIRSFDIATINEYCPETVKRWLEEASFTEWIDRITPDNDMVQLWQMTDTVQGFLPQRLSQFWNALDPGILIDQICMRADQVKADFYPDNDPFLLAFDLLSRHPGAGRVMRRSESIQRFGDKLLSEPSAGARSRAEEKHFRRGFVKASPLPHVPHFNEAQDELLKDKCEAYLGYYFSCTDAETMIRLKKTLAAVGEPGDYLEMLISTIDRIIEHGPSHQPGSLFV